MASAVLLQRPGDEARLERPDLGVRILSVETTVQRISLTAADGQGAGPFDFDFGMTEMARTKDSLKVGYSITFRRRGSGQACALGGVAVVRFSNFNPEADFGGVWNDLGNEMAVEIFRKDYEAVYLLHESAGAEAPSPWITQGVTLSSRGHEAG